MPVGIVEGAERQTPSLIAIGPVGQQAEIGMNRCPDRKSGSIFHRRESARSRIAVGIVEWTERQTPPFISIGAVGNQAEISEESVDIRAIGHGRGRCRAVSGLIGFFARPGCRLAPEDFAGSSIETDGQRRFAFECSDEDAVFGEDRRGVAGWKGCFPEEILLRVETIRNIFEGEMPEPLGPPGTGSSPPRAARWRGRSKAVFASPD